MFCLREDERTVDQNGTIQLLSFECANVIYSVLKVICSQQEAWLFRKEHVVW